MFETNTTVAELMDKYAEVVDWDLSTRKANEAYIRRVIKRALGHLQGRKMPAARVPTADRKDDPEHPQHPVWRLFHRGALGVDLLEPGGVG